MKRILSFFIVVAMLFSMNTVAFAATGEPASSPPPYGVIQDSKSTDNGIANDLEEPSQSTDNGIANDLEEPSQSSGNGIASDLEEPSQSSGNGIVKVNQSYVTKYLKIYLLSTK